MNKKFLFYIFFLLNLCSCFAINFQNLKPLNDGEILIPTHNVFKLTLKTNADSNNIYFESDKILKYQISIDKRKVLFQYIEEKYTPNYKIYILDGNDGSIRELGNVNTNWLANDNFKYLITNTINPSLNMLDIDIFELTSFQKIKTFSWISQQNNFIKNFGIDGKGFTYSFFISNDKNYDFVIYARGYRNEYGNAYLDVENELFDYYDYP